MTPKQYYKNYQADDNLSRLSDELIDIIINEQPVHAFDFGCGSGKHLDILNRYGISTIGMDISFMNVMRAKAKYDLPCIICSDERYLRNLINCDVVFTCSVLDHIEDIDGIIRNLKRIANKSIILAETRDVCGEYYFSHDYESFGFLPHEIIPGLEFTWKSPDDNAIYKIWKWNKQIKTCVE